MSARSVPDELVQAAAFEMHLRECGCVGGPSCATWRVSHEFMPAALQAAFAKLPECEAVEEAVRVVVYDGNMELAHRTTQRVLAALAREFGGQE